jgi:PhnB protein
MPTLNTYLNFMGNTEEAFNFYKSVFGGEFTSLQRFSDTPEKDRIPINEQHMLMHVALPVGGNLLMGTDALESMGHKVAPGTNMSISVDADSEEQAHQYFKSLSVGGTNEMPLQKMFWNALFGMITDKFGVQWMVSYDYNKNK